MQFTVITLFPEAFSSFLAASLLGKAQQSSQLTVQFVNPRAFATDKHHTVDDVPYGGGDGMVLKVEPIVAALESITTDEIKPHRILLTPQGRVVQQRDLERWAKISSIVLVCGRYEGFDERIRSFVDEEVSLGDFVLNGGEVAAMAVIDGVARLLPGVIGNASSLETESHAAGLLEYPQYTRPRIFRDASVPDVLLEGNHAKIAAWRGEQMQLRTQQRRPDLWARHRTDLQLRSRTYVGLVHSPVLDRTGQVVTTAITNLDLHDIARSAKTFGLAGYFVITPLTSQKELANQILGHWEHGFGATYNRDRSVALSLVQVIDDVAQCIDAITQHHGRRPLVVATSAQASENLVSPHLLPSRVTPDQPVLVLFGTGWGLSPDLMESVDCCLPPVVGAGDYNHLSVRSAAAIILDRLFCFRE